MTDPTLTPGMPDMPELPRADFYGSTASTEDTELFTSDQLRAYGESCFAAGRAEASKDAERLDFVIAQETTWYPGRARDNSGRGILCWGWNPRSEAVGMTMRDAIDAAFSPPAATPTKEQP